MVRDNAKRISIAVYQRCGFDLKYNIYEFTLKFNKAYAILC